MKMNISSMRDLVWITFLIFNTAVWAGVPSDTIYSDDFEVGNNCPQIYIETFTGADGDPWPMPWTAIGSVALADLQNNRGRFRPTASNYSLARLFAPIDSGDVEVRFTVLFEDISTQGVGFYVRQNGGYLQQTMPTGQGYAVFAEGFRTDPGIGVWREINGVEQSIQIMFSAALNFQNNVAYRVRFRVTQMDAANTLLQAKIWPLAELEPVSWQVEVSDNTPELQNISGGIALDSWSSLQAPAMITSHTLVDDVEVETLCN